MLQAQQKLIGADFIRCLACLGVLCHHLAQRLDPHSLAPALRPLHSVALMGSFGVGAFFVLSGYLLSRPFWMALDGQRPLPSLRIYALRRLARIGPGFWLALTVSFLLSVTVFGHTLNAELMQRFLAGLFFVSGWHWLTLFPVEINGPLWSIGFEVMSYTFLPLSFIVLFFGQRFGLQGWPARILWLAIVIMALTLHAITLLTVHISPVRTGWQFGIVGGARVWMPEYNVFGFYAVFTLGALGGGVQVLLAKWKAPVFDLLFVVGLALAALPVWSSMQPLVTEGWGLMQIPYGFPLFPIGMALALAVAPSSTAIGHITEASIIRFTALISFGLYVWHYPVLELVQRFVVPVFFGLGADRLTAWLGQATLTAAVSFLLAFMSYRLIERPALDAARRFEVETERTRWLESRG